MATESRRVLADISNASLPDFVAASAEKEKATTKAPKKRPAPEEASDGEDDRELWEKIQEQYTFEGVHFDKDCNQVRRMIHRLIDNGAMKIGEFCKIINVSNKSYNSYMKQSGPMKGAESDTYAKSLIYFNWREKKGLKLPTAASANKKQKKDSKEATPQTSNTEEAGDKSKTTTKKKGSGAITAADLADITLPKEDTDDVEVYDSCDEIRKKINAHLREPGVTQAQFCRDLAAMCHTPKKPKSIQSRQLTAFRDKKGADAGNTSVVYYAAYVFFEKLRLRDGKPKSNHRKGMEEAWSANGGMDVDRPRNRGVWVGPGVKQVKQDQFGRYNVTY
ncbi:uncharacterized protein J3D65DRAFT_612546 [Phyllosticta citribraziliensis]|uniref:DUF7726 domain-containing protein n=1 Tax=Phyllosticta citribraziliensis TaxID=989973 RepID=A0ABR1M3A7_9PEZI